MRKVVWRVRVKRALEVWVDVDSFTAREAEIEATKIPGVISVFVGSALRGDETAVPERPAGVSE